jgi:hypothetical protein
VSSQTASCLPSAVWHILWQHKDGRLNTRATALVFGRTLEFVIIYAVLCHSGVRPFGSRRLINLLNDDFDFDFEYQDEYQDEDQDEYAQISYMRYRVNDQVSFSF